MTRSGLDRFVEGRAALPLALGWGLAEATAFFLVPDLLLTLLGVRSLRRALQATLAAVAGALAGGALMYCFGAHAPQAARDLLDLVPAIDPGRIESVHSQLDALGLAAILIGPTRGIPYKIYAVEWGARGGSLTAFLLVSVPARGARFVLASLLAGALARLAAPWTRRRASVELSLWALCWIVFYLFYFWRMGW